MAIPNPQDFLFYPCSRVSGSSLQGRNHSPTSPAFHHDSPQIPRACPTLTTPCGWSILSQDRMKWGAALPRLLRQRGPLLTTAEEWAASAGRDWWAGRGGKRDVPLEGKRGAGGMGNSSRRSCRGPETSSEHPETCFKEASRTKCGLGPGPDPRPTPTPLTGDRRPALRALALHRTAPRAASRCGTSAPPFPSRART